MIQFNLLPDVKLEYMRVQRTKRMATIIASVITGVSMLTMIILLVVVFGFQRQYMSALSADISKFSNNLKNTEDINKILTVQNQLNSLTRLHEEKPDTSRLFRYIQQVTPQDVTIDTLNVDFDAGTINISGATPTLVYVNQFVDTLKFTDYSKTGDDLSKRAFSEVVMSSFGRADNGASYTVDFKFDPEIFSNIVDVKLLVPANKVTTRSETEKPKGLFENTENDQTEGDR